MAAHRTVVRQSRKQSREQIVAAAAELVRRTSYPELSVDEVAQVLGRSPSTVGVQLLRARQLLRKAMEATSV